MKHKYLFKSVLLSLVGVTFCLGLTSCNQGSNNEHDQLKDIYLNYCDGYVSIFDEVPANIAYTTIYGDKDYSILVYKITGLGWKSDNEKYYAVKHYEDVFNGCDFTYNDYKMMYKYGEDYKIDLPELKQTHPENINNSDASYLDTSDLKAYSLEHDYYYSKDIMDIFRPVITYTHSYDASSSKPGGLMESKYVLHNTMIKDNTLMIVNGSVMTFVYHPLLSKTFIADAYNKKKDQIKINTDHFDSNGSVI